MAEQPVFLSNRIEEQRNVSKVAGLSTKAAALVYIHVREGQTRK